MTFLCVFYNPKRLGQLLKKCQIMIIFLFQGGGSEQTSFLSLLDPDQPELKRKLRKKIKLDTQKIGNQILLVSHLIGKIPRVYYFTETSNRDRYCRLIYNLGCIVCMNNVLLCRIIKRKKGNNYLTRLPFQSFLSMFGTFPKSFSQAATSQGYFPKCKISQVCPRREGVHSSSNSNHRHPNLFRGKRAPQLVISTTSNSNHPKKA